MTPSIRTEVTLITPELAQRWLEQNVGNRPKSEARVRKYAAFMKQGRWKLNGDSIRFSRSHRLLDGQHRLAAVVMSGVSITALVVFGLDDDVFPTLDRQKGRTNAETLAIAGETNYAALSKLLAVVANYESDSMRRGLPSRVEPDAILALLRRHPLSRRSAAVHGWTETKRGNGVIFRRAVFLGFHYLFALSDRPAADEFLRDLATGTGLRGDDPVLLLREQMIAARLSTHRLEPLHEAALVVKAWNLRRAGKTVRFLKWRQRGPQKEAFPLINGMPPETVRAIGDANEAGAA